MLSHHVKAADSREPTSGLQEVCSGQWRACAESPALVGHIGTRMSQEKRGARQMPQPYVHAFLASLLSQRHHFQIGVCKSAASTHRQRVEVVDCLASPYMACRHRSSLSCPEAGLRKALYALILSCLVRIMSTT